MRILAATLIITVMAYNFCWPTIINIPADYSTIQQGIDASTDGDTVLVQPGTFYENINFNGHNIVLGSLFLMTGDTSYISQTAIAGDSSHTFSPLVSFSSGEDITANITGLTIKNNYIMDMGGGIYCDSASPMINYNIIRDNYVYNNGGGIYCGNYSNPIISKNTISDNITTESEGGGGIYCADYSFPIIIGNLINGNQGSFGGGISCVHNSNAIIIGNIISYNSASDLGGAIYCRASDPIIVGNNIINNVSLQSGGGIACILYSNPVITNNTIIQNSALAWFGGYGGMGGGLLCFSSNPILINNSIYGNVADSWGGGLYCQQSYPLIVNNIYWANSADSGGSEIYIVSGFPLIEFCNIQDTLWPGEGNIDIDPLFRDTVNGDFQLMSMACGDNADSPCIDAGSPFYSDSLLDCSWGLGTTVSDMGAYGGGDSLITAIFEGHIPIPGRLALLQNYPNPFNVQTTIRFTLPEPQNVELTIYDLLGRQVQTLLDEHKQAGVHTITFNASHLSSGVYFYRLQAGDMIETKRMVLLK